MRYRENSFISIFGRWPLALFAALAFDQMAWAQSAPALIDFKHNPSLLTGPSTCNSASVQTVTALGEASISSGYIAGNPSFFAGINYATAPNLYVTAGSYSGCNNVDGNLQPAVTIAIDPAYTTTEVSFELFNGAGTPFGPETYTVNAYNGTTVVAS